MDWFLLFWRFWSLYGGGDNSVQKPEIPAEIPVVDVPQDDNGIRRQVSSVIEAEGCQRYCSVGWKLLDGSII
jgi:hypothetical protein